MTEWRTIDSAPRDGTVILISDARYSGYPAFAAYFDSEQELYPWRFLNPRTTDGTGIGEMQDDVYGPTHWMPLPEPPEPNHD